ncbi:hypothetical protein Gogos_019165 [Gossypium gossypioides]|uniref:DUF4283 domain-containing protein n=1 Tax=Gossypium gossypioides TaxID=34282 RepID=A0A7J9BGM1_GOSGO|nr:hypothetical protein [Gossypium gossypioides]
MEADTVNMSLEDEEEESIPCERELNNDDEDRWICLVGRALIDCVIHFLPLKRTMADLWHPLGVIITYLGGKRYLFRVFYEVDIKRVLDIMSWTFNRHLLIFHRLSIGEYPKQISLFYSYFWIQVHNLPYRVISEGLARKLGEFVGQFIQFDVALISRGEQRYMRFRVKIDLRLALKRKKKLTLTKGQEGYAYFQYVRLPLFCFLCGKLGHWEGFFPVRKIIEIQEVIFGWNLSLRAPSRNELLARSIWLMEELPSEIKKDNSSIGMELYGRGRRRIDGEDFSQREWSVGQREAIIEDTPVKYGEGKIR